MKKNLKEFIVLIILFVLSIGLYLLTLRGVYGNPTGKMIKNNLDQATKPLELSPERGRYILVLSLGEEGSLALNKELGEAAYPDVGYRQGRFYIFFAPGVSLLALPFYLIGKQFNVAQAASFFVVSLFATFTLLFLYKICRNILKLPIWISLLPPIIFGFGSTSWSYANTLYQHHITAFCIVASFYAVWKYRLKGKHSWIWALFAWFNYALAISVDYPNVVLMLPVMIYFFFGAFTITIKDLKTSFSIRLSFLFTSILFAVLLLTQGYYNNKHYGGWTKVSNTVVGYKKIQFLNVLNEKDPEKVIEQFEKDKTATGFFKEDNLPRGLTILLFAIDKGIFLFSPIFILAVFGILKSLKSISFEIAVMIGTVLLNLFVYSSFGDPWGGWAYGPRYLIPSMAILSVFVAVLLARTKFQITARILAFLLFAVSSAVGLLGALTTNAVPPKIEADFLKMKYNFLLNWDFLVENRSSSFIYNTYLSDTMTLMQYFVYLYFVVLFVMYIIMFVLPLFNDFNKSLPSDVTE